MGDINAGLVSEPGLAVVEIVAGDEATLQAIAGQLAGAWASTGVPVDVQTVGDSAVRERCTWTSGCPRRATYGSCPRIGCGSTRLRGVGGSGWTSRCACGARQDGRPCTRQAAEWPDGFVEVDDPGACWSHLDEAEREWCLRAREAYRAAFWELKRAHYEASGHDRNGWCADCTWPSGQRPAARF